MNNYTKQGYVNHKARQLKECVGLALSIDECSGIINEVIYESQDVTNETGLTPRELQKSHAELLDVLCKILKSHYVLTSDDGIESTRIEQQAEQAIKNAKP